MAEEADALFALEDRLVQSLEKAVDAWYLGRWVSNGYTVFVFHVPAEAESRLATPVPLFGDLAPYRPEWLAEMDPVWEFYDEVLYPSPREHQFIQNRHVLEAMEEHHDRHDVPRTLDHFAYFATRRQADSGAEALRTRGFATDDPVKTDADKPWMLQFHREDALADGRIDGITAEVLDVIEDHDGDYDGWGAPVVAGDA